MKNFYCEASVSLLNKHMALYLKELQDVKRIDPTNGWSFRGYIDSEIEQTIWENDDKPIDGNYLNELRAVSKLYEVIERENKMQSC